MPPRQAASRHRPAMNPPSAKNTTLSGSLSRRLSSAKSNSKASGTVDDRPFADARIHLSMRRSNSTMKASVPFEVSM